MPQLEKETMAKQLYKDLEGKNYIFFSRFSSLKVSDFGEIRRKVEKVAERSVVAKNTMIRRVLNELGIQGADQLVDGSVFLTIGNNDPQIVSRILIDYNKEKEGFQVQGAYLDGQVYQKDFLKQLADLPSREVLIASVAGGISAPLRGFVNVLAQVTRSFVIALDQIQKKKAGTGAN